MHETIVKQIKHHHRRRCLAMKQRISLVNRACALIRITLGWSLKVPEKERKKIEKEALRIFNNGDDLEFADMVAGTKLGCEPFETMEALHVKAGEGLAKGMPVWEEFGKSIRGFGLGSLAVIIGEAGDLSNYATDAKLWKRMGVAVLDGTRQGGLTKAASDDDWIRHGYNRKRRSWLWNIGDSLIKAQVRKVRDGDDEDTGERKAIGRYGEIYLRRKAYESERDPGMSKLHAHRRAQRYMEKRLLRDLWKAWGRGTSGSMAEKPEMTLSPASSHILPAA